MAEAPRDQNHVPTLLGVDSIAFLTPTTVGVNSTTHALLVEGSFTPPALQNVNITEVGGSAFALGQQLAASSLPVVLTAAQIATLTPLSTVAVTQSGSWTVTANAGTNLNTSLLALESGGNLATLAGKDFATETTLSAINAKLVSGTDIGDVTVNNAAGAAAVNIQDGGNTITVDGTVAVTQSTSPWIVAGGGTAGSAATGVVTVQGITSMTPLLVTPAANSAVNLAQYGGNNVISAGTNGALAIGGTVATNTAITANPLNLGAQAVSSENSAVTTARQVQLVADLVGKLIVLPYANPENFVSGAITSAMTGTTSTSLIAAPASGLRNYITQITVSNSHATVGTDVIIQDGNAGTTLYTIPAAAVYGGAVVTFPTPLRQPTTATAIYCANVTTGASTKVSASGYKGA